MTGYMAIAARCVLGLVFAVSFSSKVRSRNAFSGFVDSLRPLKIVPRRLIRITALAVIFGEGASVVCLAVPVTATVGLVAATGLLMIFIAGIIYALYGGVRVPCRCFGASTRPLGAMHITRNVVLAEVGALGMLAGPGQGLQPAGTAVTLAAGAIGALLIVRLDDIADLFIN